MTTQQQTRDLFWRMREEMVARHRREMQELNKQELKALAAYDRKDH